ncbi:hypothetical protein TTHERM_002653314, partial (macronuclear) [Tetrahymena thermophila SB210]
HQSLKFDTSSQFQIIIILIESKKQVSQIKKISCLTDKQEFFFVKASGEKV